MGMPWVLLSENPGICAKEMRESCCGGTGRMPPATTTIIEKTMNRV